MKNAEFAEKEVSRIAHIRAMIAMEEARIVDRRRELAEAEARLKYFNAKADMEKLMKLVDNMPPYDEEDHDELLAIGAAVE